MKRRADDALEREPRPLRLQPLCRISQRKRAQWWLFCTPGWYGAVLCEDMRTYIDCFFVSDELTCPLVHTCLRVDGLHALCVLRNLPSCEWHAPLAPCLNQENRIVRRANPVRLYGCVYEKWDERGHYQMLAVRVCDEDFLRPAIFKLIMEHFDTPRAITIQNEWLTFDIPDAHEQIIAWLRDAGLIVQMN
jgi:hypothetical protein